MVGQVVAGAVAPVVVNSATDETGLVNQLFKIGILIGGLIVVGLAIAIAIWIFSIDFGGIFDTITAPFRAVFSVFDSTFSLIGGGLSGIGSALGFGGGSKGATYKTRTTRLINSVRDRLS